ncbi:MAG: exodeoxyribonuclease V subunit gamma, partial [Janthinobacterium lividum]
WLDGMREGAGGQVWLQQIAGKVADKNGRPRGEKLIDAWLRQLAAAAMGHGVTGYLVARDAVVTMAPLERLEAQRQLESLLALWREGMNRPLPVACKTSLALVQDGNAELVYDGGHQSAAESAEPSLARLWPDFDALSSEPGWLDMSTALYGPLAEWLASAVQVRSLEDAMEQDKP